MKRLVPARLARASRKGAGDPHAAQDPTAVREADTPDPPPPPPPSPGGVSAGQRRKAGRAGPPSRPASATGSLLDVRGIDVYYGPIQALRGVSLSIDTGERIALVGANGAGKTSTLRTISGLLSPKAGEIVFDGEPVHGMPPQKVVQRGVAHLPEGRELFFGLSIEDNLRAGYWSRRGSSIDFKSQRDRVMDYFPILRERAKQAAGTLSGGEQQMLGVARALMSAPRLLIVDELSLGLAPKIVAQLFDILAEVNADGTAVLIVEQFVHMALANTDRAYVLSKGEVVLQGRSCDLLADPKLIATYLGEVAETTPSPVRTPRKRATRATSAPAPKPRSSKSSGGRS